ncbi:MAG: hypothetical protein QM703_23310 [Gemmatales bacterium]
MSKDSLRSLALRISAIEQLLQKQLPAKDWRLAAGMFTGTKISRQVDAEARKIREADRRAARREFGE